ncbi:MAG: hypothetical protein M3256_24895 [Actinomycetota bacterium]|nr:hypothetical protein [Actinomycetota bacterium]
MTFAVPEDGLNGEVVAIRTDSLVCGCVSSNAGVWSGARGARTKGLQQPLPPIDQTSLLRSGRHDNGQGESGRSLARRCAVSQVHLRVLVPDQVGRTP